MTYSKDEIREYVKKRRRGLIFAISVILCLMLTALVFILLNLNKTLTFILLISEPVLLLMCSLVIEKYSPHTLFSGEIVGTNVKEDEYTVTRKSGPGMRYKRVGAPSFGGPPIAPSTGANKRRTPPALRSAVYLRTESGSIVMVRGLYKSHADMYEDGDVLLKYAGTKYPIVISRDTDSQPCPICGEINREGGTHCTGCGLSIT